MKTLGVRAAVLVVALMSLVSTGVVSAGFQARPGMARVPMTEMTLTQRAFGVVGRSYLFTAWAVPEQATGTFTYQFQATDQGTTISHVGNATAAIGYTWDTPGTKTVTVTMISGWGTFTKSTQVEILGGAALLHYGLDVMQAGTGPRTSLQDVAALGFDYAQAYLEWRLIEPVKGEFNWLELDDVLKHARQSGVRLVLRVYRAPQWARPADGVNMPANPADLADFMAALVQHCGPEVAGYVIWNEPNLAAEWENKPLDAAAYVTMLKAAYDAGKGVNPDAVIVSAGLAPTTGGAGAIDDLTFFQQMHDAGLASAADVIGMNGLGFHAAPDDTSDPQGLNFSRLAQLHAIMVANGTGSRPAWALEVGWVADTTEDLGAFNGWKVSEVQQARYLKRALAKAAAEWPWLQAIFIWNLDFIGPDASSPEQPYFAIRDRMAYRCLSLDPALAACPWSISLPLLAK